jgi:hypothetical protein
VRSGCEAVTANHHTEMEMEKKNEEAPMLSPSSYTEE